MDYDAEKELDFCMDVLPNLSGSEVYNEDDEYFDPYHQSVDDVLDEYYKNLGDHYNLGDED